MGKKKYSKIILFAFLLYFAAVSFSSPLLANSHTDYCYINDYVPSNGAMHYLCLFCDCEKKSSPLLRLHGTVDRGLYFSLDNLFLSTAFLWVLLALWGLHTLISLKTRMNN